MPREGRYKKIGKRNRTALRRDAKDDCARLVVMSGEAIGRKYDVLDLTVIGRNKDECTLAFDDPQISRRHAIIAREPGGQYTITDADSRNGTFVNDAPITHCALAYGDRIRIGAQELLLARHSPSQGQLIERQRFEALGRLAAGVAHDFNNMLGVVRANLDYLEDYLGSLTNVDEVALECVADGREGTTRAADLAGRLLAFGRSGQRGHRAVNVSMLCQEIAHLLRGSIHPSIEVECDAEPKLQVIGDVGELHQLLMNLLLNARDAMPDGGEIRITARHRVTGDETEQVVIRVQDTGAGMDAATRERIFEPFFTTKEGEGGVGLGLSMVRDIVSTHAGEITVRSAPREGTCFEVVLPAAAARARQLTPVTLRRPRTAKSRAPQHAGAARVLVVDDEEMVRRSARRLLRHAGHVVFEAEDGNVALDRFRALEPRPDLVLLDLLMPTMGGEHTLAELVAIDPEVRVLVCSGHLTADKREELLGRGVSAVLDKPYSGSQLLAAVDRALSARTEADDVDVEDEPTTITDH